MDHEEARRGPICETDGESPVPPVRSEFEKARKQNRCGCADVCSTPSAGAGGLTRRRFLAVSGLGVGAMALDLRQVIAGPFESADFAKLVPPDKKLRPAWVQSLTERGEPQVYSKKRGELKFIGMPIGGICAGNVYLGGDGRLWNWDIFNANQNGVLPRSVPWNGFGHPRNIGPGDGAAYVDPHDEESPLQQGFALKVDGAVRPLDATGWDEILFRGEYPIGTVQYTDPACPVTVTLTAYSPFIPLNADDSGLPATICEFHLKNTSKQTVDLEIGGWLQNASNLFTATPGSGARVNTAHSTGAGAALLTSFDETHPDQQTDARPDITVDDFEHPTYGDWKVEGDAFGSGPIERKNIPTYQGDVGGQGQRVVNSHASAPGNSVGEKDSRTGQLTSPLITIQRRCLQFYIGGGSNVDQVGIRLLVDGKVVRRAAGRDDNHMLLNVFDVKEFAGKQAQIQIYDNGTGAWGNVGVDDIVQTDSPQKGPPLDKEHDAGTMALMLLGKGRVNPDAVVGDPFSPATAKEARRSPDQKLIGSVAREARLAPGKGETVTFIVAWNFPNSGIAVTDAKEGNYYSRQFPDAAAVATYVAKQYARLSADTKLWRDTWYDSTLPYWFLDRAMANTSILATTTAHRFGTGRFWGWEGIGCCWGTCCHVWHYAQAPGRIFPELERYVREHVDFGVAFNTETGMIGYRGEGTGPAIDGQCGRILGVLREHQMSADAAFLKRIWPNVRKGIEFLMHHDTDGDGLLDGAQDNTLDAAWFGKIAWISSLYGAALRAGEEMAGVVGDAAFATLCHDKFLQTKQAIETQLFNGEYFIQLPDPAHAKNIGTYSTCHIDQVQGQSWAWQVSLGRILDREKTLSALNSLYRYNFAPDVGPFREQNPAGRAYALAGDAGLIMATNVQGLPSPFGDAGAWQVGYFNECMTGFEHQAASHMIAEGLVQEGLAVTRAIHDRYNGAMRNPYNEIECSDHYSRAMASYGSFITICGFECNGPQGHIGFSPRLSPENFRAAFTSPEGWGTYAQKQAGQRMDANIRVKHGRLVVKTVGLACSGKAAVVKLNGKPVPSSVTEGAAGCVVKLAQSVVVEAGQHLDISVA